MTPPTPPTTEDDRDSRAACRAELQRTVESLTAQCQRDHELAFVWADQAQAYRAEVNVAKDRVAELAAAYTAATKAGAAANARADEWKAANERQRETIELLAGSEQAATARVAALESEGMADHDAYNEALHREAAANARVAELERERDTYAEQWRSVTKECDAAKARVAELESELRVTHREYDLAIRGRSVATEPATPDEQLRVRNSNLRELLDAANARIVDAESAESVLRDRLEEKAHALNAANARAEAAESVNKALRHELSRDMPSSGESEAAALRSELDHEKRLTAEQYQTIRAQQTQAEQYQDEAAALREQNRAHVDQTDRLLRNSLTPAMAVDIANTRASLAAATALLEDLRNSVLQVYPDTRAKVDAFLSSTPAPSERAAAERAVLDVMAAVKIVYCAGVPMINDAREADLCRAELARRAVVGK